MVTVGIAAPCCRALARLLTGVVLAAVLLPHGARAETRASAGQPDLKAFEGLWSAVIFLKRGVMESQAFVELARDHEGELVGNISLPAHDLLYIPLADLRLEGAKISFSFSRYSPHVQVDVISPISGVLAADGSTIEGEYVEGGKNPYPITLTKIGPPGTELPLPAVGALHPLSPDSHELKRVFNSDQDKVRAMLLVSPTCSVCLNKAQMLQRYLINPGDNDGLAVYLVWGPMQGKESEEDARQATRMLVGPQVTHFWTPVHDLAEAYMKPLGLENDVEPAWDTYLLFPKQASWGDTVPVPTFFMWEEKPFPVESSFNAETFVAEIKKLLSKH